MKKSKHTSEHYFWGTACEGWRLLDSAGLSIIEERMPPDTQEKKHFHQTSQQFFYILEGEATFIVEEELTKVMAGEGIHIEARQRHLIQNRGERSLVFLVISQPSTIGDRIEI
ncbi:MAG TPA: cupin domain-containing protein [Bacteroidetes bacterium]|nr:cupin domain-containing protein [Bacteroidota bacterium]